MNVWNNLIKGMDIPDRRKHETKENLRWFIRNGGIRNHNHMNFDAALTYAKDAIRSDNLKDK